MSASAVTTRAEAEARGMTPWKKGQSGNPAGMSPERRALNEAIEKNEIPKVLTMLAALYERGIEGDDIAAKEWLLQVRGPIKSRDDDKIESAIDARLMELIAEERRRRAESAGTG